MEIVHRDQLSIETMAANVDAAREMLQRMINEASELGATVTAGNWEKIMRSPEPAITELITAHIQPEQIGGFQRKRSAVVAELDLPDFSKVNAAAAALIHELTRRGVANNMLTVQDGEAIRNEASFQHYVDTRTIYATDPELWLLFKQLEQILNDLNTAATERGKPGIQIVGNKAFQGWFIIEPDGRATINPEKYRLMVG